MHPNLPVYLTNPAGRPMRGHLDAARRANEAAELAHLQRQEETKHRFQEAMERIKGQHKDLPEELLAMYELVMSQAGGGDYYRAPELPLARQVEQFVRARAYQMPGMYIDRHSAQGSGFEVYDFATLTERADRLIYDPSVHRSPREPAGPRIEIWHGEQSKTVWGEPARALLRWLHYQGVFLVEAARRPCPECGAGEPKDCDTCGGLGWIVPEAEATQPKDTYNFAKDAAGEVNEAFVRSNHRLLDSCLQAMATLQEIKRLCSRRGPLVGDHERLFLGIETLVDGVLPFLESQPAVDTPVPEVGGDPELRAAVERLCEKCHGVGRVHFSEMGGDGPGQSVPCPACDGTGRREDPKPE